MNGVVHCPNPVCGHPSRLCMDPPGRVFRCPRCQSRMRGGASSGRAADARRRSSHVRQLAAASLATIAGGPRGDSNPGDDSVEWPDPPSSGESSLADSHDSSWSRSEADFRFRSDEGPRLGRYRILGVIGEGRHARVYRGHDPLLERAVALKVPLPGVLPRDTQRERFLAEARALARLRHAGIVPVFELGRDADRCFIAMALIEGESLAERLDRKPRPVDSRRAAEIVADLAEALDYAHGQGVLHRDVKPANILFDGAGKVYLTDFGIAFRPESGELPRRAGTLVGTPAYTAPEQASGEAAQALPAGDQYSLGAVLYELLCGRTPFSGPPLYVLFQAMNQRPPSPRSVHRAVPAPLAAICLRALARSPGERYGSCRELSESLRRWLATARA